jgi:hypothetical protein
MPTLPARNADVLITMDGGRREPRNAGLYAENGKPVVRDGEIVTLDMKPVIATHNRSAAKLLED